MRVEEHTITLAEGPVFYRSARPEDGSAGGRNRGAAGGAPVAASEAPVPVYLHGAPTSSEDWVGLLERTGGIAPDLLGFGRSAKGGHLEYSPESLAAFVDDLLSELAIDRFQLVTHGWGTAAGVLLAGRYPERVERLAIFNSVPLLPGLTWPAWSRAIRLPGVGELAMGSTTKTVLTRWLWRGSSREVWPRPWGWRDSLLGRAGGSPNRVDRIWDQFDQGTQRAVIRLQRSVDQDRMNATATALESLRMPVLVMWGARDPWWGPDVLDAYAARLPEAQIERLPDAGHWPWLEDLAAIDQVAGFLESPGDH